MDSKKARWLFLSLPKNLQDAILPFLSTEEKKKLLNGEVSIPEKMSEIQSMQLAFRKIYLQTNPIPLLWGSIMLVFCVIAFFTNAVTLIMTFCLYAVLGFFIFSRRSYEYWKFLLRFSSDSGEFAYHLILSFSIFLLVYTFTSLPNMYTIENPDWFLFLRAGLIAPIFEEALFREFMFASRFRNVYEVQAIRFFLALVFSSAAFAAVHISDVQFISLDVLLVIFSAGIMLALLRTFTGRLIWPILVHAASNITHLTYL
ncbi:MAG: CPBP family intramembrane metalloprotease [Candidatus Hydrogenedentota bacterium]|nr:MAG: CPBP family intramembrane metalloprotease [Candidatus Hydrogenedentota bacterium]